MYRGHAHSALPQLYFFLHVHRLPALAHQPPLPLPLSMQPAFPELVSTVRLGVFIDETPSSPSDQLSPILCQILSRFLQHPGPLSSEILCSVLNILASSLPDGLLQTILSPGYRHLVGALLRFPHRDVQLKTIELLRAVLSLHPGQPVIDALVELLVTALRDSRGSGGYLSLGSARSEGRRGGE